MIIRIFNKALILLVAISCNSFGNGSEDSVLNAIQVDEKLIDQFNRDERLTPDNPAFSYEIIEEINYDIDNNNIKDKITLLRLKDWNDPGEFHKIIIEKSGIKTEYVNFNGWDKRYKLGDDINLVKSKYVILFETKNHNRLLVLNGIVYGSGPSCSALIDVVSEKNNIVLNKDIEFDSIEKKEDDSIIIHSHAKDNEVKVAFDNNKIIYREIF